MAESTLCSRERRLYLGAFDDEIFVNSVHGFVLALLHACLEATEKLMSILKRVVAGVALSGALDIVFHKPWLPWLLGYVWESGMS